MAIDFPSSPANNDVYTDPTSGNKYTWNNVYSYWAFTGGSDIGSSSNTYVLFNDSDEVNGTSGFTFDKSTNTVTIGTATVNTTNYSGTANNANYVKANNGITSNSSGVFVTQGTGTVVNATGVHVNSTYIGTLSSNNASFLGGVAAASYVNTSGTYTITGVHTHNANIAIGTSARLIANGVMGTNGQILTSNGTTVYWETPAAATNTAAQYAWTNNHTFTANLTVGNTTTNSSFLISYLGMSNPNTFTAGTLTTVSGLNTVIAGPFTISSGNTITITSGSRIVIV